MARLILISLVPGHYYFFGERSGSMVECLTRYREAAGHIYPSLVLAHPRKTCPCSTERLLMGRKESNQIKIKIITSFCTARPFLQFFSVIYLISSVFEVLCLKSFGASMTHFQNWFLSQLTVNLSRESVIL